jgi:hypothetical protein
MRSRDKTCINSPTLQVSAQNMFGYSVLSLFVFLLRGVHCDWTNIPSSPFSDLVRKKENTNSAKYFEKFVIRRHPVGLSNLISPMDWRRVCGSVVGWGIMLQAGRSRFRNPIRSLNFSNWPNPSSRNIALRLTQLLTEMSTRNLPRDIGWKPYRHLWADCLDNVGASTSHNLLGLQGLLQGQF